MKIQFRHPQTVRKIKTQLPLYFFFKITLNITTNTTHLEGYIRHLAIAYIHLFKHSKFSASFLYKKHSHGCLYSVTFHNLQRPCRSFGIDDPSIKP